MLSFLSVILQEDILQALGCHIQILKLIGCQSMQQVHEIIRKASVCMYEGEINMVIHADGGRVEVEVGMDAITIRLIDQGPGIPDVDRAMEEGYSTAGDVARDLGFGAGMGLPNMKRYSDEMRIDTTVGVGTTVTMRIDINNG